MKKNTITADGHNKRDDEDNQLEVAPCRKTESMWSVSLLNLLDREAKNHSLALSTWEEADGFPFIFRDTWPRKI